MLNRLYTQTLAVSKEEKRIARLVNRDFFYQVEKFYNQDKLTGNCGTDAFLAAAAEITKQGADFSCLTHDSLMALYSVMDCMRDFAAVNETQDSIADKQKPMLEYLYSYITPLALGNEMESRALYTGERFAKRLFANNGFRALARTWDKADEDRKKEILASPALKNILNKAFQSHTDYGHSQTEIKNNNNLIPVPSELMDRSLYQIAAQIGGNEILIKYSYQAFYGQASPDIAAYYKYDLDVPYNHCAYKGTPLMMLTGLVSDETERLLDFYKSDEKANVEMLRLEKVFEKRDYDEFAPEIYRHLYKKYGLVVTNCGAMPAVFTNKNLDDMTLTVKDYVALYKAGRYLNNFDVSESDYKTAIMPVLEKIGKDFEADEEYFKIFDKARYNSNRKKFVLMEKFLLDDDRFWQAYFSWEAAIDNPNKRRAIIKGSKNRAVLIDIACDALKYAGIEPCRNYKITRFEFGGDINQFDDETGQITLNTPKFALSEGGNLDFFKVCEMIFHENWHKSQGDSVKKGKGLVNMADALYMDISESSFAYCGNPLEMDAYQTYNFVTDLKSKMCKNTLRFNQKVNADWNSRGSR